MKLARLNSIVATGILMFSSIAEANQVSITNGSLNHKPITVVYQVAHKNEGKSVILEAPQTVIIDEGIVFPVELAGFDYAGIVPVSVDGHVIPKDSNQFDMPEQCSLTTDKMHSAGLVKMTSKTSPDGHKGSINCEVKGGVFN